MPAYKDKVTGTWYVKFYSKDWTGERKQIKRRGFETKKDALDFERNFKVREEYNLDMTFDELLLTFGFVHNQSEAFVRKLPVLMPALMKYRHMFYKNSPSSTSCTA